MMTHYQVDGAFDAALIAALHSNYPELSELASSKSRTDHVTCELSKTPGEITSEFKKAMRRLTSTVSIIATSEGTERFGMVATTVNSVCAEPPAILVCVNQSASIFQPLLNRQRFSVNMLAANQSDLISIFGGKVKGSERFQYGTWGEAGELPFLINGQATLFCRLDGRFTYSSHEVIIGRVEATLVADQIAPLLWQDGQPAISRLLTA